METEVIDDDDGLKRVSMSKARNNLPDLVNQVCYANESFLIHRRGRTVAALVPEKCAAFLEFLDERIGLDRLLRSGHKGYSLTLLSRSGEPFDCGPLPY